MEEDLLNELRTSKGIPSIITVAGIGGGGGNAVNHMFEKGITGVNFVVCNTDRQAVDSSSVRRRIVLGEGLGAGNDPLRGRNSAIDSIDQIKECFTSLGTQMLFLTAGMGGGTGTGATPVIARLAREMGILTVAIVTTPFTSEGEIRVKQAAEGLDELKKYVDAYLVIENDAIARIYGDLPVYAAFRQADDILASSAKGIAELITIEGKHNVDFADVKRTLTNSGRVHMSVAVASGENRVQDLIDGALNYPLMEQSIEGARKAIINISASTFEEGLTLAQTEMIRAAIRKAAGTNERGEAINIIWGTTVKPELGDNLELILVATDFQDAVQHNRSRDMNSPVVLGSRKNRYADIESVIRTPAFQRRKFKIVVEGNVKGGKEVLHDRHEQKPAQGSSLFDDIKNS